MTDEEIRTRIEQYWDIQFSNWGGDSLYEALDAETDDEAESGYDRACELLDQGTKFAIQWGG